jgi:hypothetical protein
MTVTIKTFSDKVFVGEVSDANKLDVIERGGGLICQMKRGWLVVQQVFVLFWGVLLASGVWSMLHQRTRPWIAILIFIFFGAFSWLSFFRTLAGMPHFVVSGAAADIELFRSRTREPWRTIHASEIAQFTIEARFYRYKQIEKENAVLILLTTAGERFALCGSPDKALIASLGEKLASRTQRKVEANVAT